MYYFTSDYTEGCTPEILETLAATNFEQTGGYGIDPYCETAALLIKKECGRSDIDVHFMTGGTQTNLTIICAALRPFHGVYGTVQSHINTHEAGAIERTGHKVIDLPTSDGKITAAMIRQQHELYLGDPSREHLVQPKMVYISQPTEIGSLYHKEELEALYAVCRHYGLYLFIDGARLGYGLTAPDNDLTLADITNNCDVFCIGGTKCGALFGEAAVIINPALKDDFRTIMKQGGAVLAKGRLLGLQFETLFTDGLYYKICRHGVELALQIKAAVIINPALKDDFRTIMKQGGAVLAKGRLLGLQFETLFTDGLYYKICRHGVELALQIKAAVQERGLGFVTDSTTNQQFIIFPQAMYDELSKQFALAPWEYIDDGRIAARICTSWATDPTQVDRLCSMIKAL